jgi:hypothetical protein
LSLLGITRSLGGTELASKFAAGLVQAHRLGTQGRRKGQQQGETHFQKRSLQPLWLKGRSCEDCKDLKWLGLLFETLMVRDLRVLAEQVEGRSLQPLSLEQAAELTSLELS